MEKGRRTCHPPSLIFHPSILVRTNGIEPSRPHGHGLLRPARLPVPPRPHRANIENTNSDSEIQEWRVRWTAGRSRQANSLPNVLLYLLSGIAIGKKPRRCPFED